MGLNSDQYRLTEAEHQKIFDTYIKDELFAGAKLQDRPVAVIFGGQPGAGKSVAVDAAARELESCGGAIQIIGDDLRGYHPQYARLMQQDDKTAAFYTDRDTGQWVEKSIAYAKEHRLNMVIEGTMRDGNKVADTMESLRSAGYEIDARALAVNERLSQQGIIQRYENQKADRGSGRMTTPESHQAAYEGMPVTLERIEQEKLADRVTIYRRGGEAIYTNELQFGEWVKEPQARAIVEDERSRPMNFQERINYADGFDKISELMLKPERHATSDEINSVEEQRQRVRRDLSDDFLRTTSPVLGNNLDLNTVLQTNGAEQQPALAIPEVGATQTIVEREKYLESALDDPKFISQMEGLKSISKQFNEEYYENISPELEATDLANERANAEHEAKTLVKLDQFVGEKFNELIKAEEKAHPGDNKLHAFVDRLDDGNHEVGTAAHNVAVGRDIRLKTDFAAAGEDFPAGVPELMNQAYEYGLSRMEPDALAYQRFKEPDTNAPCIGSKMNAPDYNAAINKLGGDTIGKIDCPKSGGEYCGKIIQVSDTHIVQQVGKNIAIAHDIKQLSNGAAILNMASTGQLKGKAFDIHYNHSVGNVTSSMMQPVRSITKPTSVSLSRSQIQNIRR